MSSRPIRIRTVILTRGLSSLRDNCHPCARNFHFLTNCHPCARNFIPLTNCHPEAPFLREGSVFRSSVQNGEKQIPHPHLKAWDRLEHRCGFGMTVLRVWTVHPRPRAAESVVTAWCDTDSPDTSSLRAKFFHLLANCHPERRFCARDLFSVIPRRTAKSRSLTRTSKRGIGRASRRVRDDSSRRKLRSTDCDSSPY